MTSEAVQPLRINKSGSSPVKVPGSGIPRALTELSPTSQRRNSPSWNQSTKKIIASRESSPFDSSPYANTTSPRSFWKAQSPARFNAENSFDSDISPSVIRRRSSIEKLKMASRVKNSAMFAREQKNTYDPNSMPIIERPLAAGRPLAGQVPLGSPVGNAPTQPTPKTTPARGHRRGESQSKIPLMAPSMNLTTSSSANARDSLPSVRASPGRDSPPKSALSPSRGFQTLPRGVERHLGIWEDQDDDDQVTVTPPRALRRKAKSVTFDTAPPEINEYELVTPDPSSVASGSREGSYETDEDDEPFGYDQAYHDDDSFDASLEDTEKTPVVLPGDWHRASPDTADQELADPADDAFAPTLKRSPSRRSGSNNSDGESRPLPPLPGVPGRTRGNSLSNTAERIHNTQRSLPQPPAGADISKADILSLGQSSMTLEDRLALLNMQNSPQSSPEEKQRSVAAKEAARLQKHGLGIHVNEDIGNQDISMASLDEGFSFPRISRESILRRVKSRNFAEEKEESPEIPSSPVRNYDAATLDPDEAIPSREASSNFDEFVDNVTIKAEEDEENALNFYDIPEIDNSAVDASGLDEMYEERDGTVVHHLADEDAESTSVYSPQLPQEENVHSEESTEDEAPATPTQETILHEGTPGAVDKSGIALPDMSGLLDDEDFQLGLQSYMSMQATPPPLQEAEQITLKTTEVHTVQTFTVPEPTPEIEDFDARHIDEPNSPNSVIRHSMSGEISPIDEEFVPEQVATIKAPGTRLKTRPSLTPADMQTMANTRRIVSGQSAPPIPERSPKRLSMSMEPDAEYFDVAPEEEEHVEPTEEAPQQYAPKQEKRRETFGLKIDVGEENDLSFGLDKEFERITEASKVDLHHFYSQYSEESGQLNSMPGDLQPYSPAELSPFDALTNTSPRTQKGYLMRQNTKVVVAKRNFSNDTVSTSSDSGRPTSSDGVKSPTKGRRQSNDRTKAWTKEPYNGRRRSVRTTSDSKKYGMGVAPPLPGHESALDTVVEDKSLCLDDEEEDIERGRLFVKVVGAKDLDLPLPPNERSYFRMNLDNGLHCVTTAWSTLSHNAPIGQEFELVVLNELEFQLTLQTKLTPPPKPAPVIVQPTARPSSPTKSPTKSVFRNLWTSPKKREQKAHEEREAERKAQESRAQQSRPQSRVLTAWDFLHDLVGEDGSFGRAYFCLKNHEDSCFGRQLTVDLPLYNEWAVEDAAISSSVKSKNGGLLRRPPYQVGALTLQLLYVPRPKGCTEEDMPKSMNACLRELKEAEETKARTWEGALSQQGGDCPYWRRRYFVLKGSTLIAYHERTNQARVKIDLSKAAKLIDDKSSLVRGDSDQNLPTATKDQADRDRTSTSGKPRKGRRKSAFAEEEEGYMFVESGFRIRFANGEVIDFYADSAEAKDAWMAMLSKAVGTKSSSSSSSGKSRKWCDAILAKEKAEAKQSVIEEEKPSAPLRIETGYATVHETLPSPTRSAHSQPDSRPVSAEDDMTQMSGALQPEHPVQREAAPMPEPVHPDDDRYQLPSQTRPRAPQTAVVNTRDFAQAAVAGAQGTSPTKSKHRSMLDMPTNPLNGDFPVRQPGKGHQVGTAVHATAAQSAQRGYVHAPVPMPDLSPKKQEGKRKAVKSMLF